MTNEAVELKYSDHVAVRGVAYTISYKAVVLFSELSVLFALITCVVTALIFQFDEVLDRDCGDRAPNIFASISSVTGISPQRYIWRICIALHSAPRIVMAFAYYNLYISSAKRLFGFRSKSKSRTRAVANESESDTDTSSSSRVSESTSTSSVIENNNHVSSQANETDSICSQQSPVTGVDSGLLCSVRHAIWLRTRSFGFFQMMTSISVVLNLVELSSLIGISYISNRDNYPVHEKLFELFGICHLLYSIISIWLSKRLHEPAIPSTSSSDSESQGLPWTPNQRMTYTVKSRLAVLDWLLTTIMAISFSAHCDYCIPYAFSVFALTEYVATISNMAFHYMAVYDFPGAVLLLGVPSVVSESDPDVELRANGSVKQAQSPVHAHRVRNGDCANGNGNGICQPVHASVNGNATKTSCKHLVLGEEQVCGAKCYCYCDGAVEETVWDRSGCRLLAQAQLDSANTIESEKKLL